MKKIISATIILTMGILPFAFSQHQAMEYHNIHDTDRPTQKDSSKINLDIQEIGFIPWHSEMGLLYKQVPGINLGVTSFQVLHNHIAFLSDASNELIITDKITGKYLIRFSVGFAPIDFVFDQGLFYVLEEKQISVYNESGKIMNQFLIPEDILATKVLRFKNETYITLPTGNCIQIESTDNPSDLKHHEGYITQNGNCVLTKLSGDNYYYIKITTPEGNIYEKKLGTDKKVAGIFVVGSTNNRIILDLQTFISENPVSIERSIVSVELTTAGIGEERITKQLPNCYYVYSNTDIYVSPTGVIFNMITSAQGIHIFSLTETKSSEVNDYPTWLKETKYHYNYHLISVDPINNK